MILYIKSRALMILQLKSRVLMILAVLFIFTKIKILRTVYF